MSELDGKIIGVTGLSSGIGAATARLLIGRGAKIVGFDRHPTDMACEAFHTVDLGDLASIAACARGLTHRLDFLLNIAGLPPTADKRAVLMVNFFGLRHFTHAVAGHLAPGAGIVNVASLAGLAWRSNIALLKQAIATPDEAADAWIAAQDVDGAPSYHLSKELLIAWTLASCAAWRARGHRINCVSPGPVATPILKDFIATLGPRVEEDLKNLRAGEPDEIAPVIAFLCTHDARWINGADIGVDGGAGANAWTQMLALAAGPHAAELAA